MTQVTLKMIQRGDVRLITINPLTLQGITASGAQYLLDTKDIGIAGTFGKHTIAQSIDDL